MKHASPKNAKVPQKKATFIGYYHRDHREHGDNLFLIKDPFSVASVISVVNYTL
jgi:hypothetical protein